jgi:glycosyltransferase involved in cell wall biosynthesis
MLFVGSGRGSASRNLSSAVVDASVPRAIQGRAGGYLASKPKSMTRLRTLILASARVNPEAREAITDGRSPRKDFLDLAAYLDADLVDHCAIDRSWKWRSMRAMLGTAITMACIGFSRRRRYDHVFSDGEHIGLPLALLLRLSRRRLRHVMIGHLLTTRSKRLVFRFLKPQSRIDITLLHATHQSQEAVKLLGVAPDRIRLIPYQADTRFWRPQSGPQREPLIATAGLEYRDYHTLAQAVRGLPAHLIIAAGSHWSRHRHNLGAAMLPANVEVVALDYLALRDLYARAAFVVVPLRQVDNQAGITTILEAMAMGKAVIVSATAGQRDVIRGRLWTATGRGAVHGDPTVFGISGSAAQRETGIYVPPADPEGLRRAMTYLLEAPGEAERLGTAGRELVETWMDLDGFVVRVADALQGCAATPAPAYAG